jgi:RNA polymerase sigma-70 factor (ECF subfamily)
MHHSEDPFVQRLRNGDDDAFRSLVDQYQKKIYNTCLSFVKDEDDADDLTQDVFIEVYNSISRFRGASGLGTWIYRIAVTKSLDQLRRSKRKKRQGIMRSFLGHADQYPVEVPDFHHPGVIAENRERSVVLWRAIDRLPENQRVAFTLHKVEGLSHEQIGKIMKKSTPSVESLMHRAKQNLRKDLYDYYNS